MHILFLSQLCFCSSFPGSAFIIYCGPLKMAPKRINKSAARNSNKSANMHIRIRVLSQLFSFGSVRSPSNRFRPCNMAKRENKPAVRNSNTQKPQTDIMQCLVATKKDRRAQLQRKTLREVRCPFSAKKCSETCSTCFPPKKSTEANQKD